MSVQRFVALLLAGGKGTRTKESGRLLPKPLLFIGDTPVINRSIETLLALGDSIERIQVLVPRSQTTAQGEHLDMKHYFERWKNAWYDEKEKVEIIYEEDIAAALRKHTPDSPSSGQSAMHALHNFLLWIKEKSPDIIVINADNYFEDDLQGFLAECAEYPRAVVNAVWDVGDKNKVRSRFGVVTLDGGWVTAYEEKPADPKTAIASLGIYRFPFGMQQEVSAFLQSVAQNGKPGPGELLEWYLKQRKVGEIPNRLHERREFAGIRGYPLAGQWFDVGTPEDLVTATITYARTVLSRKLTVADLVVAERAESLDDKYYLVARHITVEPVRKWITLEFDLKDKTCSARAGMGVPSIDEIKEEANKHKSVWKCLVEALGDDQREGAKAVHVDEVGAPLLLSCGAVLFDTSSTGPGSPPRLDADRTRLPLIERDPAAPADAGRLTTPAGRMDMLNVDLVCLSELLEEQVFYGSFQETNRPVVYCVSRPPLQMAKAKVLRRLSQNGVSIPGLDPELLKEEATLAESAIRTVQLVEASILDLGTRAWTVEVKVDGVAHGTYRGLLAVYDEGNCTLEFRRVLTANISDFANPIEVDRKGKRLGRLMGIADGDGFARRSYMFRISDLLKYIDQVKPEWANRKFPTNGSATAKSDRITQCLFQSGMSSGTALAVTAGGGGRFSAFNVPVPAIPVTTAVARLLEMLNYLTRP